MTNKINYPIFVQILFWLLWVVGIFVILLFALFTISSINGDQYFPKGWGYITWDIIVIVAEIFLLVKTARHFFKADIESGVLLMWIALAAIGIPLIGFGGCTLPEMVSSVGA